MSTMIDMLFQLGSWGLDSFWLPMLVWTVVAIPAVTAQPVIKNWAPAAKHRLDLAILLALPAGLILVWMRTLTPGWTIWPPLASNTILPPAIGGLFPTVEVSGGGFGILQSAVILLSGAGLALVVAVAAGNLMRLILVQGTLRHYLRYSCSLPSDRLSQESQMISEEMGVRRTFRILVARADVVPFALGCVYPTIVLPQQLLTRPLDRRLALAHELAHVYRGDLATHLLEQLIVSCFRMHPLVTRLSRRLETSRELACDALVLSRPEHPRRFYADLVFRYGSFSTRLAPETVALSSTTSNLTQRIEAMNKNHSAQKPATRRSLLVAATVFGIAVGLVACADFENSDALTNPESDVVAGQSHVMAVDPAEATFAEAFEEVDDMPNIRGGIQALMQAVKYPDIAKREGIEGTVYVEFVVDEEGKAIGARAIKGVHEALDAEAVRALGEVSFTPGLVNGKPVKTKMLIPIKFKLQ